MNTERTPDRRGERIMDRWVAEGIERRRASRIAAGLPEFIEADEPLNLTAGAVASLPPHAS